MHASNDNSDIMWLTSTVYGLNYDSTHITLVLAYHMDDVTVWLLITLPLMGICVLYVYLSIQKRRKLQRDRLCRQLTYVVQV
jgi:Ca2+/Na+ antiporter